MNHLIKTKATIIVLLLTVGVAFAQKKMKQDCNDPLIKSTADNLKEGYLKQGMTLYQETMLDMTSMEPTPIAVRLYEGVAYQLVYVGAEHTNKLIFQLFDGKDNKIDEQRERGKDYLIYQFTPNKTDIYLINLYQKKGVRDMCGYFGVLFKTNGATPTQPQVVQQPNYNTPVHNNTVPTYNRQPANTRTTTTTTTTTTRSYNAQQRQQQPTQQRTYTQPQYNNNAPQRNASQAGTYTPPPATKSIWQQSHEQKNTNHNQPLKKFSEEPPVVTQQEVPRYQSPKNNNYQAPQPQKHQQPARQADIYQPPPVRYNDANERTTYRETTPVKEEVIYNTASPRNTPSINEQPRYQPTQPVVTETPKQPIRYQRTTTVTNTNSQRTNYQSSKQQREAAQKTYQQQTQTTTPSTTQYQNIPDNQRPNPNRTRATREAMQDK